VAKHSWGAWAAFSSSSGGYAVLNPAWHASGCGGGDIGSDGGDVNPLSNLTWCFEHDTLQVSRFHDLLRYLGVKQQCVLGSHALFHTS
jgi:hypothetical protein